MGCGLDPKTSWPILELKGGAVTSAANVRERQPLAGPWSGDVVASKPLKLKPSPPATVLFESAREPSCHVHSCLSLLTTLKQPPAHARCPASSSLWLLLGFVLMVDACASIAQKPTWKRDGGRLTGENCVFIPSIEPRERCLVVPILDVFEMRHETDGQSGGPLLNRIAWRRACCVW